MAVKPNGKPVTDDKAAVIAMLRSEGMRTKQIAETLGLSTHTIYHADEHRRKTGVTPYLTPKRLKSAVKVVDTFMQGKPIGREVKTIIEDGIEKEVIVAEGIYPKDTTVKDCAMSVLDRQYPKKEDAPAGTNISFTKIDLTVIQGLNPPIDVKEIVDLSGSD